MRSLLIVIGVLLIVGGIAKGAIYYVAFERLPEATYQVWGEAEHRVTGMTSEMMTPFANAVGDLGVDVPAPQAPAAPGGPSAAVRQQFEAIAHDIALLCLLQYVLLGVAAGSIMFAVARILTLLETRVAAPGYAAAPPTTMRKY